MLEHAEVSIEEATRLADSSLPTALIELSSQVILAHVQFPGVAAPQPESDSALNNLTPEKLSSLRAGEAYLWSSKSTDTSFSNGR
jgi:hypothetical protein